MTGLALRMRLELARLVKQHGVFCDFGNLPTVGKSKRDAPLLPDCDAPVLLSGIASAPIIDQDRVRFSHGAISWITWRLPPLLYRHAEAAGTINSLQWTARGLEITATTDHIMARNAPAFSVAATIRQYKIVAADSPSFHAEVTSAILDEVSLTPAPANPQALVLERRPASTPHGTFYDLIGKQVEVLRKIIAHHQQGASSPC